MEKINFRMFSGYKKKKNILCRVYYEFIYGKIKISRSEIVG